MKCHNIINNKYIFILLNEVFPSSRERNGIRFFINYDLLIKIKNRIFVKVQLCDAIGNKVNLSILKKKKFVNPNNAWQ